MVSHCKIFGGGYRMASPEDSFDFEKVRREIFEARNRNIWTTIQFVSETAAILTENGRLLDFKWITHRSTELLHGNLILKMTMLLNIICKCYRKCEWAKILEYNLDLERLIYSSGDMEELRMVVLLRIATGYFETGHYSKTVKYTLKAENIADAIESKLGKATCYENLGGAYLRLAEYQKAMQSYEKGLTISLENGDRSVIASFYGNIGNVYCRLGNYQKAIQYSEKSLAINETGDLLGRASVYSNLGNAYLNIGQYKKATQYYEKGLAISTEIGDQTTIAGISGNLGNAYLSMGLYDKAIQYYEKGLAIRVEIGGNLQMEDFSGNFGTAFLRMGDFKKAIQYYEKSLAVSTKTGDRSGIARNKGNLGLAYHNLGEYEKAIQYNEESLAITKSRSDTARCYGNLGEAYSSMGQYEKALQYYEKALAISTEIGYRPGIAVVNSDLGYVYLNLGEYEKAIHYYEISLAISNEMGDRSGIAREIGNLGNTYSCMGRHEKSIQYTEKSLAINTEIGNRSGILYNYGNLGNAYLAMGQYEKAIHYYEKSLAVSTEIGDQHGILSYCANLGNAYLTTGHYKKSIEYFEKSEALGIEIGDRLGIASCQANLGNTYYSLGDCDKAVQYYEKSLEINADVGNRWLESVCLRNIGSCYILQSKYITFEMKRSCKLQLAVSYIKRSLECCDMIFSGLTVDENKTSFTNEYFSGYVALMSCFILLQRIEAALLVVDLGKAKALHSLMEKRKTLKSVYIADYTHKTWQRIDSNEEKMQTDDIERVLQLKQSDSTVLLYSFDCDKFLNIWVLNGEDGIKHEICTRTDDLTLAKNGIFINIVQLLSSLSVQLNLESSLHKLHLDPTPHEKKIWKAVHESYDRIFLRNKSSSYQLNMVDIIKIVQRYDLAVDIVNLAKSFPAITTFRRKMNLQALFQGLIQPVENLIKGTKLIIVPDEFLFFVPFCSLPDERGCPVTDRYSIQITPSLHTLCCSVVEAYPDNLGFAFFVGNPIVGKVSFRGEEVEFPELPYASGEAKCLASLFDAKPLVESAATKERVLKCIQGAGIIHIAAHGDEERGEIFLTPNPDYSEQGSRIPREKHYLLKERDIISININARLVVLCCCDTGKGKVSSEGVVGLARAFLAAGARSVLATLWPIHDEATKEFMQNFYYEILKETTLCEALRRMKNMFRRHQNFSYRSFEIWGPFTIVGEDVKFTQEDIEEIKRKSRETTFQFES